ncbi:MAG: hypothetical protein U0229_02305 [Anaeromyxobacter sp.]
MNLLRAAALLLALVVAACAGAGPAAPAAGREPGARGVVGGAPEGALDGRAAREALDRFAAAVEGGDFERACALLSARWRVRTSPARLARDHAGAGPSGREAVARARRAAASAPLTLEGGTARLALGDGRYALLVAERGAWRVDALDAKTLAP